IGDTDAFVRRNAAWALGRLGDAASRSALTRATTDLSGLVRMTAKAALAQLR
nr:HEAT repeat domain-containing protein [Deltaproteobacteria bacterium]